MNICRECHKKNCAKRHIRPLYVHFRGDIFFVLCLVPSVAQLSSASFYFLFIDVDGLDNILPSWSSSTSTSMTMIFLTNQRPRKCDMTYRKTYTHFDDQCPPGSVRRNKQEHIIFFNNSNHPWLLWQVMAPFSLLECVSTFI